MVKKFVAIDARAVPLLQANLDTDQIIPARFLRKPRSSGLQDCLFHDLRFDDAGLARPAFILNDARYQGAKILVTGRNFGCGSSREAAVYALWDYGFRAVIAPSFGDIFLKNCLMNRLLPVTLPDDSVVALGAELDANPGSHMRIDLDDQSVKIPSGAALHFAIDGFSKHCLLQGLDELDFTASLESRIIAFERALAIRRPWL